MIEKHAYDFYNRCSSRLDNIPKRIIDIIVHKKMKSTEAIDEISKMHGALMSGNIIIISGGPGCGKTVASIYAGLEFCISTGNIFYFMTSREYLKAQFNGGDYLIHRETAHEYEMQPESTEALLIIDDLGREYFTDKGWGIDQWDSFFDKRYRDKLPTLITTNMEPEELVEKYNERILDRIRECGTWISISGDSMRKNAK